MKPQKIFLKKRLVSALKDILKRVRTLESTQPRHASYSSARKMKTSKKVQESSWKVEAALLITWTRSKKI